MRIYESIRNLAKSTKAQNLFVVVKDISTIRLFNNSFNLSKIQEYYLNWLYNYDSIMKDIVTDNISKHVIDDFIYEESYLLWRKDNKYKKDDKKSKNKDVHLIAGKKINFDKR